MVWYGMVWYGKVWYGMVWYGMVWYGMVWYGMVWYGMVWYGMVWYGMVWYGKVWYGMVWYGMVWYGMVWYGMVWYGMVWYGMVWYGMVWYGIVSYRRSLFVCYPLLVDQSVVCLSDYLFFIFSLFLSYFVFDSILSNVFSSEDICRAIHITFNTLLCTYANSYVLFTWNILNTSSKYNSVFSYRILCLIPH